MNAEFNNYLITPTLIKVGLMQKVQKFIKPALQIISSQIECRNILP